VVVAPVVVVPAGVGHGRPDTDEAEAETEGDPDHPGPSNALHSSSPLYIRRHRRAGRPLSLPAIPRKVVKTLLSPRNNQEKDTAGRPKAAGSASKREAVKERS
jgi:hypothetical protein